MFLGLVGFWVVVLFLATVLLTVWKPGGVRHARKVGVRRARKERAQPELDVRRERVDVSAVGLALSYVRHVLFARKESVVLAGVDAVFRAGEVSVIMGPSGAGKSTLLRLLAGRNTNGGVFGRWERSGEVRYNGVDARRTRGVCALVEQGEVSVCFVIFFR